MTTQNYLEVQDNVVTNCVLWDGNTQTWTPPSDATMLIQSTTPAVIWNAVIVDNKTTDWVLSETLGAGGIGFTWDGSVLTTDQPKPEMTTYL
jgi:hypothetical protein